MPPLKVLLAEDDPLLREILCEGLSEEGFEVVAAEDGVRALELFKSRGPWDALLVDEEMPRLTGRQFLARLREAGEQVPAILVSGNLELEADELARLRVGPVQRKPISIRALASLLRDLTAASG